jgi:hypothetical protein
MNCACVGGGVAPVVLVAFVAGDLAAEPPPQPVAAKRRATQPRICTGGPRRNNLRDHQP